MADETQTRTFRAPPEVWKPFVQLVPIVEQSDASTVLRKWMADYLERYGVFWEAERPGSTVMVAWYDCEECNQPHRLDGTGAPWGCSVQKAYTDRQAKAVHRG